MGNARRIATNQETPERKQPPSLKVICPLHGIRTHAEWQRELSDLATSEGWSCHLGRWSFGRFSIFAFVTPLLREAKLAWLRAQYDAEINDRQFHIKEGQTPSVVAHSFGTYILGYTLLRYDYIRFDKVILCGSILPRDFPWDLLIARGQVQAVRNEFGVRDPWVRRVRWFVRGTGPSGAEGFTRDHARLEQEKFDYDHGEYFERGHMRDRWIPFLNQSLPQIPRTSGPLIPRPKATPPLGLYGLLAAFCLALTALLIWLPKMNADGRSADSFEQSIKFMNPSEQDDRFPVFWSRYGGRVVNWRGEVVGSGGRSYLIRATREAPEYSWAEFTLGPDEAFTPLKPDSVVDLQGIVKNIGINILVERAKVLRIVKKVE